MKQTYFKFANKHFRACILSCSTQATV